MSRLFYHTMQDNAGNLLFGVSGTMRVAGSGTLATIYGDEALTVILPNPMTNHPSFGSFKCFLPNGDFDFYMAKAGYTFETLTGVQGLGSMAQQDASAVAITGGIITGLTRLQVANGTIELAAGEVGFSTPPVVGQALRVAGATTITSGPFTVAAGPAGFSTPSDVAWGVKIGPPAGNGLWTVGNVRHDAAVQCLGRVGMNCVPPASAQLEVQHDKGTFHAIKIRPSVADTGPGSSLIFHNLADTAVGNIQSSATATIYNTTSDARLKHAITPLTGALDVVRSLRPITGRWIADDSPLSGFLAHEVAEVVDGVITGDKDATNPDGTINPQMIDYSKLVPWLVGAVKELTQQVETLTAQLAEAGA